MLRIRLQMTLLSLVTSLSLTGCGQVTPQQTYATLNHVFHEDGIAVQLTVSENPIVARTKTNLMVHVSSGTTSRQHFQVEKVWIQESMLDMSMPKSITIMNYSKLETYKGQVIFPMGGPWSLQVYVKLQDKTVSVSLPVHVQE